MKPPEQCPECGRDIISTRNGPWHCSAGCWPPKPSPLHVGLTRLSLQPGDVLVVTVPDNQMQWGAEILAGFAKWLPADVGLMWKTAAIGLSLFRAGQPVAPEVDEPVTVEAPR